jgi:hypothetical protein
MTVRRWQRPSVFLLLRQQVALHAHLLLPLRLPDRLPLL